MAGLPLLKLSSLFIKALSKPLATRLKIEAGRSPKFHEASVHVGQASHYLSSRLNVFASGYKFLGVKPLPTAEAMEMGVSYIADGVVILLGATIIIVEYVKGEARNKAKADKAAALDAEQQAAFEEKFAALHRKINDIELAMPIMQQVW
jgi:optic atrophy 3 protein